MTPDERRHLARTLAAIDLPHPLIDPRLRRRRRFGLLFITACCLGLAAWIAILVLTLPERYTSHYWPAVWVGLDIAELACFAATAWAAWHQRQILIFLMVVTGTLLVCDAWFDLALAYGSRGFLMSLLSALFVELPLAVLLFTSARRLVRVTITTMMQLSGIDGARAAAVADPAVRGRPGGGAARSPQAAEHAGPSTRRVRCHSRRRFLVFRDQMISKDRAIPRGEPWTRASTPNTAR